MFKDLKKLVDDNKLPLSDKVLEKLRAYLQKEKILAVAGVASEEIVDDHEKMRKKRIKQN